MKPVVSETKKLIPDFGDTWFLKEYLSRQAFYPSILNTLPDQEDTLLALVFYRLLTYRSTSRHAKIWYEGNYSYLAFPHANLTNQNISRVLKNSAGKKSNTTSSKNTCHEFMEIKVPPESLLTALVCLMPQKWISHK